MSETGLRLIVVGAGFAGLSAAGWLAGRGHEVTVLEARDRVGGRVESEVTKAGRIDTGGQFLCEDMPEIWRRLEAVGLQTTEACGDTPRVVLGSPRAGVAADEVIDPTPGLDELGARCGAEPDLANLPRKF